MKAVVLATAVLFMVGCTGSGSDSVSLSGTQQGKVTGRVKVSDVLANCDPEMSVKTCTEEIEKLYGPLFEFEMSLVQDIQFNRTTTTGE